MNDNQRTVQTYDEHIQAYIATTRQVVEGDNKDWLDRTCTQVRPAACVLELGSAFGRDAAYLIDKGYDVLCTDAAPAFVQYLKDHGFKAEVSNALTDH